jgi:hypothetical protein
MTKYRQEIENETGWTEDIYPLMRGYKMACCDCGLVHDMQFDVVEISKFNKNGTFNAHVRKGKKWRVLMRARRNKRATGQMRRKKNKGKK